MTALLLFSLALGQWSTAKVKPWYMYRHRVVIHVHYAVVYTQVPHVYEVLMMFGLGFFLYKKGFAVKQQSEAFKDGLRAE